MAKVKAETTVDTVDTAVESRKVKVIISLRKDYIEIDGKKGVVPPAYVGCMITKNGKKVLENFYIPIGKEVEVYEEVLEVIKNRKIQDYDKDGKLVLTPIYLVEKI
jgi:hypothetical protein